MEKTTKNSTSAFLKGTILGAIIAGTSALLFAPRSGKETQASLKEKGDSLKEEAEQMIEDGRTYTGKQINATRSTLANWLEQGSSLLEQTSKSIKPINENQEREKELSK